MDWAGLHSMQLYFLLLFCSLYECFLYVCLGYVSEKILEHIWGTENLRKNSKLIILPRKKKIWWKQFYLDYLSFSGLCFFRLRRHPHKEIDYLSPLLSYFLKSLIYFGLRNHYNKHISPPKLDFRRFQNIRPPFVLLSRPSVLAKSY